jgi:N-acetylmuramoyl-L-alanine amidase
MSNKQGNPPCDHTVQAGDTFSALAQAYYGDGSDASAKKIADANPGVNPSGLQVGQKLHIPA